MIIPTTLIQEQKFFNSVFTPSLITEGAKPVLTAPENVIEDCATEQKSFYNIPRVITTISTGIAYLVVSKSSTIPTVSQILQKVDGDNTAAVYYAFVYIDKVGSVNSFYPTYISQRYPTLNDSPIEGGDYYSYKTFYRKLHA